MKQSLAIALLLSVSASAFAVDGETLLGGVLGGAAGAAVGQNLGGREGAIIGAAIGGGAGAAIGSQSDGYRGGEGYREGAGYREGYRGGDRGFRDHGEGHGRWRREGGDD